MPISVSAAIHTPAVVVQPATDDPAALSMELTGAEWHQ
jgi:hypothetical protein